MPAPRKKKKPAPHWLKFVDNKGRTLMLPGNYTLGELAKMGFTNFRLVPKNTPLKKNEWTEAT